MGWFFDDPKPPPPPKKKGWLDWLFEPERRNLDGKPMSTEVDGHTLTPEQVNDLRLIQQNRKKGFWD